MDPIASPPPGGPVESRPTIACASMAREDGARIAYRLGPGKSPGLIFVGGFRSDMTGTKATAIEAFAAARGQASLCFDLFAHGASSGAWEEATIGRWAADLIAVLDRLTQGPQILVGSSMGGWIMLLAALARPERIAALVGIAAAPDATEDLMWAAFTPAQRRTIRREGRVRVPSPYDPEGYVLTRRLIEEGRRHLVLRRTLPIMCPVRLIHGMRDADVPWQTSLRLAESLESRDVTLTLVKEGDHRLSTPADLERIRRAIGELL
jgi:pimeloyl-ACP methyl ester carboxylesterase